MDSDDEQEEYSSWQGVSGTIILINALEDSSIVDIAHVATCRVLRQYLRSSSFNNISVCFYGTEKSKSTFDTRNVVEIFPLYVPTLEGYKLLQNVNISSYGRAKDLILSEVLWYCSKMFAKCKKKLSSRTIIILSQLVRPPTENDKKPTLKRVVDLIDTHTEIKFVNISENEYKIDPFYETFLIEVNKGKDYILPKPMWDTKSIEKLMHQQSDRNLAIAHLNFEIGNDFSVGVALYSLLKRLGQNYHKKSDLHRETNVPVTSVTKTMKVNVDTVTTQNDRNHDADNEKNEVPLLRSEVLHYQEYGGERVEFTDSEMKMMKNPFGPPMMKLLGFKPARILCKEKWFLKTGFFLFPSENIIEGSTVAFKALHKACIEEGVVAICVLCTRANAKPIIVALVPTSNPIDLEVEIGFDVVHIPFVENVRDIPLNEDDADNQSVEEAHKVLMKDIIKSLKFDYKADMFENPKLQSEFRAIEAKALASEDIESFLDTTKASPAKFQDLRDDLFEEIFGPFGALTLKRAATSNSSGVDSKKVKCEDIDEDLLQRRINSNTVNGFTVQQIKNILKSKNIPGLPALTGLKKSDLVDLVHKYCK